MSNLQQQLHQSLAELQDLQSTPDTGGRLQTAQSRDLIAAKLTADKRELARQLQEARAAAQGAATAAQLHAGALQGQLAVLQAQLEERQAQLGSERAQAAADRVEAERREAQLQQEVSVREARVQEARAQLRMLSASGGTAAAAAAERSDEHQAHLAGLITSFNQLREATEVQAAECRQLSSHNKRLTEERRTLKAQVHDMEIGFAQLQGDRAALQAVVSEAHAALQASQLDLTIARHHWREAAIRAGQHGGVTAGPWDAAASPSRPPPPPSRQPSSPPPSGPWPVPPVPPGPAGGWTPGASLLRGSGSGDGGQGVLALVTQAQRMSDHLSNTYGGDWQPTPTLLPASQPALRTSFTAAATAPPSPQQQQGAWAPPLQASAASPSRPPRAPASAPSGSSLAVQAVERAQAALDSLRSSMAQLAVPLSNTGGGTAYAAVGNPMEGAPRAAEAMDDSPSSSSTSASSAPDRGRGSKAAWGGGGGRKGAGQQQQQQPPPKPGWPQLQRAAPGGHQAAVSYDSEEDEEDARLLGLGRRPHALTAAPASRTPSGSRLADVAAARERLASARRSLVRLSPAPSPTKATSGARHRRD